MLALCTTSAWAQQRRITGRVTAEGSGEPLASASISVVGTAFGAYTGEDGRFSVPAPEGTVTLRVRRIGYQQKNIPAPAGQAEVNATLTRDVLQLETQVVTGTATTISSQNSANSVAQVSGAELNRAPAPTIENALQGKIAGATITTNSGAPGGGAQVQIRGVTSVLGRSTPLYVVDGVIVNNQSIATGLNVVSGASGGNFASSQDQQVNRIADLNPADIENIEVLKGASAASIYGSKGSNGVILITTKRGSQGKPRLSLTQRFGTSDLSNKMGLRCFGSADEYVDYLGIDPDSVTQRDNAIAEFGDGGCNDFEEQLYGEHGLSYESSLSLSGGNGGTSYFVSGLAKRDAGIQEGTGYRKQSMRGNLGQQVGSRLNVRASTEIIHTLTERGLSGNDNNGVSPYTIFSSTPSFFDLEEKDGVFPINPYLPYKANPFQNARLLKTPEEVYRFIGGVTANFSAYASERQTLDFTLIGGADTFSDRSKIYSPNELYYEPLDDDLPGTVVNSAANVANVNLNVSAAHRYITPLFTATTSGGVRRERRELRTNFVSGRGLPPGQTNVDQALQTFPDEYQELVKDFSYYAQEEVLTLGERLLLTGAINAERSSLNGDDQKFYMYPKVAASYRLPTLPSFANELKFRVAYGKAGNLPRYGDRYTSLATGINDGVIGGRPDNVLGNPNIKPETSSELEGGFDLQLLSGRLATDVTVYRKQVDDLILQPTLSPSTGFTSKVINGGQLVNVGTEIGVSATPVQTHGFTWVSRTTFSTVSGEITRLDVPTFDAGSFFSSRYGNIRIEEGKSPTQVYAQNGCKIDLPASGVCPGAERSFGIVGDATPDFTMGFSNDFSFGPVRVASLFDWRKGGKVINLTNNYFDGSGLAGDTAASNARNDAFAAALPIYVEDAGFVKLREVTLSYALPTQLVGSMFGGRTEALRLELSGRNLYTWTNYSGLDPEVSNFSDAAGFANQNIGRFQDVTPFPPSRTFFFSVSADF